MLPRYHVLYGAIFTLLFWIIVPEVPLIYLAVLFLSSFLIDFDHYVVASYRNNHASLNKALKYHDKDKIIADKEYKRGIKRRGDFHLFHTIEFHFLIGFIGMFYALFFYIFIGMVFHSLLDVFDMLKSRRLYRREYFFFNWLRKKVDGR